MAASTVVGRLDSVDKDLIDRLLESDSLPKVTSTDNGKALIVSGGKWVKGTIATLPAVTAEDNGSTLQVVEGVWTVVAPETTGD